jgi:hypothetical protein
MVVVVVLRMGRVMVMRISTTMMLTPAEPAEPANVPNLSHLRSYISLTPRHLLFPLLLISKNIGEDEYATKPFWNEVSSQKIPRVTVTIHHLLLLYTQYLQGKWNAKESWSKRD